MAPRAVGAADAANDNLRAFGYFGGAPAMSQRAANETREALRMMAEM